MKTILIGALTTAMAFWSGLTIGERKTKPTTTEPSFYRYELHQAQGIAGMMVKFDRLTGQSEIVPMFARPAPSPWIDAQRPEK